MAISSPNISVNVSIAAVQSLATSSSTQLNAIAADATAQLNAAIGRMNYSSDIVNAIRNPNFQNSIRNSIQGLQSEIQISINNSSGAVNQYHCCPVNFQSNTI